MTLATRVLLTFVLSLSAVHAMAQSDAAYEQEAQHAKALLQKAVDYYEVHGDAALAAFSRQGEFITEQLYVYVVNTQGVMLASGGPSVMLVGRDVSPTLDDEMKRAFARAIGEPEGEMHEAEYRWVNRQDGKVERKHTFYQRINDRILAVGYYLPRAKPEEAKKLLDQASVAIEKDSKATFAAINDLDQRYLQDDLYVFVVDLGSKRFVAHGYNRRLIGTDFASLKAPDGAEIGQRMLDAVNTKGEGELEYLWRNPVTERNEHKHAYLKKVGNYLVAVGYYSR
ncbi:MAG: cache domain-containing protein [Pseudomonas sp.]|uniref:cache domain-containing protein n=1 Tax=Pseudomonas sp. TaxID=306 RepID=UPI0030F2DD89